LQEHVGVTLNVVNTTGALGAIGAGEAHRGSKDGYTWFGGAAVHGSWPVLGYSDLSWNDFYSYLAIMFPTTIYVRNDAPWESLEQMLADIGENPTGYRYGHPGAGSNGEIFVSLLAESTDLEGLVAIPYGGGREAANRLLAGTVDFISVSLGDCADMAVAGTLRPLANLYDQEVEFQGVTIPPVTDELPHLAPYIAINPFFGIYLPRETPPEIVIRVAEAFEYAVSQPRFRKTVEGFAGIVDLKMGRDADEMMARIEAARGMGLAKSGLAANDPTELGITAIEDFQWPPHDRAVQLRPWPAGY
jgi:tripartite-type tricarboxylate transporter receptor subunit TctC